MYFLRTLVFSAVLCASGAFAAIIPIAGDAGRDVIEINIKLHHEGPTPEGDGVLVSEKFVFLNDKYSCCYFVVSL